MQVIDRDIRAEYAIGTSNFWLLAHVSGLLEIIFDLLWGVTPRARSWRISKTKMADTGE